MNRIDFHDYPRHIEARAYSEAVERYARAVASRVSALYQVGNVRFPGLSDIDFIAVVSQPGWDNNQFFSPFLRLPERFHRLFHHGPRIIPITQLGAIEYGTCVNAPTGREHGTGFGSRRRLVSGSDVLGDLSVSGSSSWVACRVLEAALLFRRALDEFLAARSISVCRLVARATTLRYPMRHLAELTFSTDETEYGEAIDECRSTLLRPGTGDAARKQAASRIFVLFADAVDRYERRARMHFGITEAKIASVAVAMLTGTVPMPGVEPTFLADRHESMRRYHHSLSAFGFSEGSIFARRLYRGAYATSPQPYAQRLLAGLAYRFSTRYREGGDVVRSIRTAASRTL